jgi:hypothetical protein
MRAMVRSGADGRLQPRRIVKERLHFPPWAIPFPAGGENGRPCPPGQPPEEAVRKRQAASSIAFVRGSQAEAIASLSAAGGCSPAHPLGARGQSREAHGLRDPRRAPPASLRPLSMNRPRGYAGRPGRARPSLPSHRAQQELDRRLGVSAASARLFGPCRSPELAPSLL